MVIQIKQLTKERDVAVSTLAQMKSLGTQREDVTKSVNEMRQSEVEALRTQ